MGSAAALLTSECRYRSRSGNWVTTCLGDAVATDMVRGLPAREFPTYRGQRNYPGWLWMSTTGTLVGYESLRELDRLLLADFDPAVTWVSSQPCWVSGRDGSVLRRHVPDFLLQTTNGFVVVDVKPVELLKDAKVAAVMLWTRKLCDAKGWRYEVWSGDDPVLVTTADNVLLTPTMIAEFLTGARDSDVAVAMVERDVLLARYPQSQRTWLKFRRGWWSGANMFRLRGRRVLSLLDFWGRIERDRKKGLKIIAAFGPWLLIGALLRLFTVQQGVARAGLRFGLKAKVVPMSEGEACIDADKPVDIELIERIFAARRSAAS